MPRNPNDGSRARGHVKDMKKSLEVEGARETVTHKRRGKRAMLLAVTALASGVTLLSSCAAHGTVFIPPDGGDDAGGD